MGGESLGPTLFNVFFNDLFLTLNDIDISIVMSMAIPFIEHMTKLMLLLKV